MANAGGKIKEKRRHATSKPYARPVGNVSLLGKITSGIKDFLTPSWFKFSGNAEAINNVSEDTAGDGDDDSDVEEHSEMSTHVASSSSSLADTHAKKRDVKSAFHSTSLLEDFNRRHGTQLSSGTSIKNTKDPGSDLDWRVSATDSWIALMAASSQGASRGPSSLDKSNNHKTFDEPMPAKGGFKRPHPEESDLNDDDEDNPVPDVTCPSILTSTRAVNRSFTDHSQSTESKKQKLWSLDDQGKEVAKTTPSKGRPAFNSLLLASPQNDSSMFGDTFSDSLYYKGKTRFGGASAEGRNLNASLSYQNSLPLRKTVKTLNASSALQPTTSATAQRILETLDRMSTPLMDAKKIPVTVDSCNDSTLSFTPTSYRRPVNQPSRPMTRPLQLPSRGPPTSQHQILSSAVIASNRFKGVGTNQRLAPGVGGHNQGPDTASGLSVSQTMSFDLMPDRQQSEAYGKVRNKMFSQHISSVSGTGSDQVVQVPNLSTDYTLPISNMGPISLQSQTAKSQTLAATSIPSSGSVPPSFVFSAPIDARKQQNEKQPSDTLLKNFGFTSPISTLQAKTSAVGAEGEPKISQEEPAVGASSGTPQTSSTASSPAQFSVWGSTAPKAKASSPDIGGTSSSFQSYNKWSGYGKSEDSSAAAVTNGGFCLAPAASLKTGSVMDILGAGSGLPTPKSDSLMAQFKKPTGSWECGSCMVVNKPDLVKCVCCDTAKPGSKAVSPSTSIHSSIADLSTVSSKTNEQLLKSGSLQNVTGAVPTSQPLSALFKKAPGAWECDTCMVQNVATALRCVACDCSKPGLQAAGLGAVSTSQPLSALFKKAPGAWECDTCMVQNVATALRCVACDCSKPGLQTAGLVSKSPVSSAGSGSMVIGASGGFNFNLSSGATTTTTTGSGGFKFTSATSTPATTITPAATGFVFGQTSSNSELGVKTSAVSAAPSLTGGFKFGTSNVSDSGGGSFGTSGSGFVFGNSSVSKTGESVNNKNVQISAVETKTNVFAASVANGGSDNIFPSSVLDLNKANSTSSLFGGVSSAQVTTAASVVPNTMFGAGVNTNDNSTKSVFQQASFSFPSSVPSSAPTQPLPSAPKPTNLFQFGASSVVPASTSPLGLGSINSSGGNKPFVNGGFGSGGFQMAGVKDGQNSSLGSTKGFETSPFGTTTSSGFVFGQAVTPAAIQPEAVNSQSLSAGKRAVNLADTDQPSSKKSFNFIAENASKPEANGLFSFGGSSDSTPFGSVLPTSSAFSGGFNLANHAAGTTTGAPTPNGGFSFPTTPANSQGFSFQFKPQSETTVSSFAENKGSLPTNFNFSGAPQPSVFQFGAKPAANVGPASGLFTFGVNPAVAAQLESSGGPVFGTPAVAATGGLGNFSIGSGDTKNRIMKKAVRRTGKQK